MSVQTTQVPERESQRFVARDISPVTVDLPVAHSPQVTPRKPTPPADAAGVFVSIACGIHCLLTPILLIALPSLGEAFHQPVVHRVIAVLVTAIAAWALWRGFRQHHHRSPLIVGLIGLGLIWSALLFPHEAHEHDHFHLPLGTIITMVGSLFLIMGHLLNVRASRCTRCACHAHE